MELTREMMEKLTEPFDPAKLEWKPGAVKGNRALALTYADAREYQRRLDLVIGPLWADDYEVTAMGNKVVVVCRLTLCGVQRTDVGECLNSDPNALTVAAAQAFKRSAAKFGLGRYLYDLPRMWVEYDPQRKRLSGAALAQLQQAISGGNGTGNSVTQLGTGGNGNHSQGAGNGNVGPTEFWGAVKELGIDQAAAQTIAKGHGTWEQKMVALDG